MNLTKLAAAVLIGGGLALSVPTAVFAEPAAAAEPAAVAEPAAGSGSSAEQTPIDADGAAVLGVFGGVGAVAVFSLFVATRHRDLD